MAAKQHRIYKCPHSGLSGCPHLRGFAQYAFYVNQSGFRRSVRLIEVSVFQGVRIEGFHCITSRMEASGERRRVLQGQPRMCMPNQ